MDYHFNCDGNKQSCGDTVHFYLSRNFVNEHQLSHKKLNLQSPYVFIGLPPMATN